MKKIGSLSAALDCSVLATFVRVADAGNISAAARSLFLAQSAVSTQMSILARAAGAPLLERVHGRWQVTASGAIFYRRSVEILTLVDQLQRELAEVSEFGHVTLASTRTISDTILASIVAGFKAAHPEIRLEVVSGHQIDAQNRLAADEVDAALVALPIAGKGLRIDVFDEDRLVLVVPAAHPLAAAGTADFASFAGEPFVIFERGSGVRSLLEDRLGERFSALDVRLELSSNDALIRCVEAGLGLTLLPERVALKWTDAAPIALVAVADIDLTRQLALVIPDSRTPSDALAAFESWITRRNSGAAGGYEPSLAIPTPDSIDRKAR
ncbi:MAG: selenium metabolism-associated LysR family transcriptional regulator [Candidatus Velthaea sp.]